MGKKEADELLDQLQSVALWGEALPPSLRGWASALGLHVRERNAASWTSLAAGGEFRTHFLALRQADGEWQIEKFDKDTWERRFAALVGPTLDIVGFINTRVTVFGEADAETISIVNAAVQQYQGTGKWVGLPLYPMTQHRGSETYLA